MKIGEVSQRLALCRHRGYRGGGPGKGIKKWHAVLVGGVRESLRDKDGIVRLS